MVPSVDALPSPARFLLRALAAGLSLDDAGAVTGEPPEGVEKRLRAAIRALGLDAPPPSAGREALLAAARPAVDAARVPSTRRPATVCPQDGVAREMAAGRLAGPLMLATLEHVGDCPACLGRLVRHRAEGDTPPVDTPRRPAGRHGLPRGCGAPLAGLVLAALVVGTIAALAALGSP